jgi:hypothetical protein
VQLKVGRLQRRRSLGVQGRGSLHCWEPVLPSQDGAFACCRARCPSRWAW